MRTLASLHRVVSSFRGTAFSALLIFVALATATSPVRAQTQGIAIVPNGATSFSVVLGDAQALSVSIVGGRAPIPGESVLFHVIDSPGSPRTEGRGDKTVVTGEDGTATATFGFGTAGLTHIVATAQGAVGSVEFTINTASLAALVPGNRSRATVGAAFDRICQNVFLDDNGNPRPAPQATPLCVFMTGVLTNHTDRAKAMEELTQTSFGSHTKTAVAALGDQLGAVAGRLSALRSASLAGRPNRIAFTLDGKPLTGDILASAFGWNAGALAGAVDTDLATALSRYGSSDPVAAPGGSGTATAAPARENRWGLFATGRYSSGSRAGRGSDETGFNFKGDGGTVGLDYAFASNFTLGFALGYGSSKADLASDGGKLKSHGPTGTLYALWQGGEHGYFQASVAHGSNSYTQHRNIHLPAIGDLVASSDFDGRETGATLEGGYDWTSSATTGTLFVRGSYENARVDAFTERGAVATVTIGGVPIPTDFGMSVGSQKVDSLLAELGFQLTHVYSFSGGTFAPEFHASFIHEFQNDSIAAHAHLTGDAVAGSSFQLFTDAPDRNYANAGVTLLAQLGWGSLFASWDRQFARQDLSLSTINAGVRFEF